MPESAEETRKHKAEADKAEQEARKARLEAEKLEREAERELDAALAKQQKDAAARKDIAESEKAAADAARGQFAALVPDLSKVDRGELTSTGDTALFGSALALRALKAAAAEVAKAAKGPVDNGRVLVTSDADLASADAVYVDVTSAFEDLESAAEELLGDAQTDPSAGDLPRGQQHTAFIGGAVAGAVAGAIPAVLSLLSAHRAVSTAAVTGDDLAAAAAVAAALVEADPQVTVRHDDFRPAPSSGPLWDRFARLRRTRRQLAEAAEQEPSSAALVKAIDAFLVWLRTVPAGGKRSPLAAAMLREPLHDRRVTHVLLVKGSGGSTAQVLDDRPLFFQDKFATVATMGVTFLLVRADDGRVLRGGTRAGSAVLQGQIGGQFHVQDAVAGAF